jgi:hypothetical protein
MGLKTRSHLTLDKFSRVLCGVYCFRDAVRRSLFRCESIALFYANFKTAEPNAPRRSSLVGLDLDFTSCGIKFYI